MRKSKRKRLLLLFKKDELKHIWPFYACSLILGLFTMILPFLIIYYQSLGFSYLKIGLLTSSFGIAMVLFEVPTGAFADGLSRKYSVIIGSFIIGVCAISIGLTANFYLILVLWFFSGAGMTFISGAEDSWIIDNLNSLKRKDLHAEYFIKHSSLLSLGAVFAPFLGAAIVKLYPMRILWFIFGSGFFINAFILIAFTKEHYLPEKKKPLDLMRQTYVNNKKTLKFIFNHKTAFLIILAGLFAQLMSVGNLAWQPFLVNLGLQEYQLGFLYSIIFAIGILVPWMARLFSGTKIKNAISIILLARIFILLSVTFIYPPFFYIAAIVFICSKSLQGLKNPLIEPYFHKFVPKKIRATVVSARSMLSQLVTSLVAISYGLLLDALSPRIVIALMSLLGFVSIILYQSIDD